MKVVAVFLLLFLSSVFGANINRIHGGGKSPIGIFDFVAAFRHLIPTANGTVTGTCTSTIISPRHILIAAHCLLNNRYLIEAYNGSVTYKIRQPEIVAGLFDFREMDKVERNEKLEILQIHLKEYGFSAKVFIHASYIHAGLFINDIAIVEFPEGSDFKIPPISLASDYQEKDGDSAIAAGYGFYNMKFDPKSGDPIEGEYPAELQNATVEVHIVEKCPASNGSNFVAATICTGNSDRRATQGDSGGPLFLERNNQTYYQVGVASMAMEENSYYTRLSLHCDWIEKVTKGEAICVPLPSEDAASSSTTSKMPSNATESKDPSTDNDKSDAPESPTTVPSNATVLPESSSNVTKKPDVPESHLIILNAGVSLLLSVFVFSAICLCVYCIAKH